MAFAVYTVVYCPLDYELKPPAPFWEPGVTEFTSVQVGEGLRDEAIPNGCVLRTDRDTLYMVYPHPVYGRALVEAEEVPLDSGRNGETTFVLRTGGQIYAFGEDSRSLKRVI